MNYLTLGNVLYVDFRQVRETTKWVYDMSEPDCLYVALLEPKDLSMVGLVEESDDEV